IDGEFVIATFPIAEPIHVTITLLAGRTLFFSLLTPSEDKYLLVDEICFWLKESDGVIKGVSVPKSSGYFEEGVFPVITSPNSNSLIAFNLLIHQALKPFFDF